MNNLELSMNLEPLTLKVLSSNCLICLLSFTPNLKYLYLHLSFLRSKNESSLNIDLSKIKLKKSIVWLHGMVMKRGFPGLTWFIK